jgi:hypothetical protein
VAAELDRKDIERFLDVKKGKANRSKSKTVLQVAFAHAVEKGLLRYNVCREVESYRGEPRDRYVTNEEFEGVKKLAPIPTRLALELALRTGQPQANILGLRWSQVHRERGLILFRNSRTDQKIEVPITTKIESVLDECARLPKSKDFVICRRDGQRYTADGFRAVFQRIMRKWAKTGNDRFTFPDIQTKWERDSKESATRRDVQSVFEDYPQFDSAVRAEAAQMSGHYEVFYCLEQSIRRLITNVLYEADGVGWWDKGRIPAGIHSGVAALAKREIDAGMTKRSDRMIDFTTFGELSVIITSNWDVFCASFTSSAAVVKIMKDLNMLRGPIAHCCPMSPDEIERLRLTVKDWFRIQKRH